MKQATKTIKMNVRKLAKEIYDTCRDYKGNDDRILVSVTPAGTYDVYHEFGNSVAAYEGDNANTAFARVIFSIELNEIDWKQPLLKFIEEELRRTKNEMIENRKFEAEQEEEYARIETENLKEIEKV